MHGLSASQSVDLMAYLSHLRGRSIRLRDRFALFRHFRILRTRPFGDASRRQAFVRALQRRFYDQSLRDKEAALALKALPADVGVSDGIKLALRALAK